jgi:GntR family transcriptional regulator, histidine utilization repressor
MKPDKRDLDLRRYKQIKKYVTDRIASGKWAPGHQVPTEFALVARFGISRTTVNRALHELTQEGLVRRTPGRGTFVTERRPSIDLLEVHNIADDIRSRGHTHSAEVHLLERARATRDIAVDLDVPVGQDVYHSVIVHLEGRWPVQLEERYVNPTAAPDYLKQDFTKTTANAYLNVAAPLSRAEHTAEAIRPSRQMQKLLRISHEEPCLLLHRRTWSERQVVSRAWLTHPGSRYRLGGAVVKH